MAEAAAPAPAPEAAAPDVGGKGEEQGTKFSKGGDNDLTQGPVKNRGCTDIICIPLFFVHIAAFWFLTFQNAGTGDPMKLIKMRDFRGDFCGIGKAAQWDGGYAPDLSNHNKLMWAMNTTNTLDKIARDVVCSQAGYQVVKNKINQKDFNAYCGKGGSFIADANKAVKDFQNQTDQMIAKYSDPAQAAKLFSGGGSSMGSKIMAKVTQYFTMVCSKKCEMGQSTVSKTRKYVYGPAPMTLWGTDKSKRAIVLWNTFTAQAKAKGAGDLLNKFTFPVWDKEDCPYEPKYCVPMPGVDFNEVGNWGMCVPKIDGAVSEALDKVGGKAKEGLEALSKLSVTEDAKKELGDVIGDILKTYDVFIIVAVASLVIGLLVLVLMRFILCPMVWLSLFLVFAIFVAGGLAIIVRSQQCADQGFVDAAQSQSSSWKDQGVADAQSGANPFDQECPGGYSIEHEDARKWAQIAGYVVLGIAAAWLLGILIMVCRIRLAIAINQVACMFLYSNPQVLLVPVIQNIIGIIWIIVWCFTAAFLLSQVSSDNVPATLFETYAEAYGTADVAGKCTSSWPAGTVYVDEQNPLCTMVNQTGNASAVPLCYKCAPPRFWFDYKFGYSFLSFLWHNFFFVAVGQCTIAGAVGVWFFTPSGEKWKKATVCVSLKNALFKHTGSLAFGSLILAIIVWLKWFMTWLAQQAKQTKNKVMEIICKIMAYCLWCFEKCVKFLNKNAYIQIALMGTNFCKSAKNAFFLILRNIARFGVIAMLSHIVHFIGMVLIIALTAIVGYFILQAMYPTVNPITPTIIYTFIGWMTAKLFIGTFALAVDATLQCFIAAEEMDAGNDFAPAPLKNFIDSKAGEKSKCCDTCCCTLM